MSLSFFVPGIPAPQGNHQAFVVNGRAVITERKGPVQQWRADVMYAALHATSQDAPSSIDHPAWEPYICPVAIVVGFVMPRPKHHYGTGRNAALLKPGAPIWHTHKPDGDKLQRAIFDALTQAHVWRDDALVVKSAWSKAYTSAEHPHPGALISVFPNETAHRAALHVVETTSEQGMLL